MTSCLPVPDPHPFMVAIRQNLEVSQQGGKGMFHLLQAFLLFVGAKRDSGEPMLLFTRNGKSGY